MVNNCNNCGTSTIHKLCKACYEKTLLYKCGKCHTEFRRHPKNLGTLCNKCKACPEYTWPLRKCATCNVEFHRNPKNWGNNCTKCYEKICKFCNKKFTPYGNEDCCNNCKHLEISKCVQCKTTYTKNIYREDYFCEKCSDKRFKILNGNSDAIKEHCKSKFEIHVTYYVEKEEHDGWCSDGFEITKENYEETKEYPLIKEFTNNHIDRITGDVKIEGYMWPLSYYNISSQCHGFCGCETKYFIKSAKVIKVSSKMDIDECPSDSDEGDRL